MKSVALAVCALAPLASADLVVVDETGATPGSVGTVQAAVDLSVAGDTVLILGSGIEAFDEPVLVSGKGITILSDVGVQARFRSLTIVGVPAGQRMVLHEVSAGLPGWVGEPAVALTVSDCAGAVRIEGGTFVGDFGSSGAWNPVVVPAYHGEQGAEFTNCADVAAHGVSFVGGAGGQLWDEDFDAAATNGGDAVRVVGSSVHFGGCDLGGGVGGTIFDTVTSSAGAGGSGLVTTDSVVSVAGGTALGAQGGSGDCDLWGCGSGGSGGDGIRQVGASSALTTRAVGAVGGVGGNSGDGFPAFSGDAIDVVAGGHVVFGARYRAFDVTSPVVGGDVATMTVDGLAGDTASVWAALGVGQVMLPKFEGPFLLGAPFLSSGPFPIATFAADGTAEVSIPVPSFTGVDAFDVTIQAITTDGDGAVLLGPAATLTLLGN